MVLRVLILFLLIWLSDTIPPCGESFTVMFWNLENFFDWKDGGSGSSDAEFSARGPRHWTWKRYMAKAGAVAKTILWTGERAGRLPDIVAVAEIENRKVLADLTTQTPLRKAGYGIVHYDSPDPRGIDVALLYRKSVLRPVFSSALHIPGIATRDILLVALVSCKGPPADTLYVLVNHHPSKYGGPSSAGRREAAIMRLKRACDSLQSRSVILTGDFNDTPDNPLFDRLGFCNLASEPAGRGEGTIRFGGRWEMIDMFLVPESLAPRCSMEVLRPPFLLVRDNVHPGEKPFRTWSGPRYAGGVSDHLPILLTIRGGTGRTPQNMSGTPGK